MVKDSKLRMPQLDSLRGLAALSVFCFHAFGMLAAKPKLLAFVLITPLGACFNGRAAVWLFFVLSGFVLNLKFVETAKYPRFWKTDFIVRRIFRIYPAFLLSLLLALTFKAFVFHPAQAYAVYPDGFAKEWKISLSPHQLARLATLILPGVNQDLNPPVWSLVEEMRISLIFPLVILIVNRFSTKTANAMTLVAAYAVGFLFPQISTVRHLPHFILGAICARNVRPISAWLQRQGLALRGVWLLAAFGLYGTANVAQNMASLSPHIQFLIEQAVGLGAAGFILFCAALTSETGILGSRPMRFIGATSYSFYLTHIIFLYALGFWLIQFTGSYAATWLICLITTYTVSFLIFKFVEMPLNRVGHHAVRWALAQQPFRTFFPGDAGLPKPAAAEPLAAESAANTKNL